MSDWPFLLEFARAHPGERFALATLFACEGSSYRPPGARMLVTASGLFSGSLSGGCLEEGIAKVAMRVLSTGASEILEIDTRPHFGCPGVLRIFIEKLEAGGLLDAIGSNLRTRQRFQVETDLTGGTRIVHGRSDKAVLLEDVSPPPKLLAIGWTRDMEPVLQMAALLGWERHRVLRDARMADEILPVAGERVDVYAPDELVECHPPDPMTAVLVMTHHLATDLGYLKAVFPQPYGYLGLLGSRRRRETLLAELGECGLLEDLTRADRFHAPVGLDLGGGHPSVIALSIIGEIQAILTGHGGGFLRDRTGSIHLPAAIVA